MSLREHVLADYKSDCSCGHKQFHHGQRGPKALPIGKCYVADCECREFRVATVPQFNSLVVDSMTSEQQADLKQKLDAMQDTRATLRSIVVDHVCDLPRFPKNLGLSIERNPHLMYYETVDQWLDNQDQLHVHIHEDDKTQMVLQNEVWVLRWYPKNPVGSYVVASFSLGMACQRAAEMGVDE